tara:strand:+ start:11502 stop:11939 length:438 start_codon:yes stop_codon:yes gene_type:complete
MENNYTVDEKGLNKCVKIILSDMESRDYSCATILALYGDLGSGKTTFTKILGKKLDIKKNIISPTFILERIYKTNHKKFHALIHIDAYRIEEDEEIKDLSWDDIIKERGNLIVVEWADKIEKQLPKNTLRIYFEYIDETKRKIQW